MIRRTPFLVGALVAVASAGHSQTGGSKKTDPGEAEMTFANGSVVRMALLPGDIEINTEFGKLTVPVRSIRRIDFGLHRPDGMDKKIDAAVKRLASAPEYKERGRRRARPWWRTGVYALCGPSGSSQERRSRNDQASPGRAHQDQGQGARQGIATGR